MGAEPTVILVVAYDFNGARIVSGMSVLQGGISALGTEKDSVGIRNYVGGSSVFSRYLRKVK